MRIPVDLSKINRHSRGMILIVDADKKFRVALSEIVRGVFGVTTLEASNGVEALAIVAAHRPALVITDANMPLMNGIGLLKVIKKLVPEAQVYILFSSHEGSSITEKEVLVLGASGVYSKDNLRNLINDLGVLNHTLKNKSRK